jgi:hypothetical protein
MTKSLSEKIIKNVSITFFLSLIISFILQAIWGLFFTKLNDSIADNIFTIFMVFIFSLLTSAMLSIFTLITILLNLNNEIRKVYFYRILTFFVVPILIIIYSLSEENFLLLNIVIFNLTNLYSFNKFNEEIINGEE